MTTPALVALAPEGFERPLTEEVGARLIEQREKLFFLTGKEIPVWAQNVWLEPQVFQFQSISEAANHLRGIQRNWWPHAVDSFGRTRLIQDRLPPLKAKALKFPVEAPTSPLGSFTLLDEHTLLYSANCTNPFPDGELKFVENKTEPPSRAYLKLWEAFTLERKWPRAGERALDLGSSPGGWTWVLAQLGCEVLSVDKAPLAPNVAQMPRVKYLEESAFALDPKKVGAVDWLFSDVICYPERLLELVKNWENSGMVKNFVCTLKFQGPTNFEVIREFLARGFRARHLFNNKHELTVTKFGTP